MIGCLESLATDPLLATAAGGRCARAVSDSILGLVRDAVKDVPGQRPRVRERQRDITERGEREGMRLADERHVRPV